MPQVLALIAGLLLVAVLVVLIIELRRAIDSE